MIRLIAFDLDGTLLTPDKTLAGRDIEALCEAAARGVELVPASGRLLAALPPDVLTLPNVRHVIAVNGAQVLEYPSGRVLAAAELTAGRAVEIMRFLDSFDVIYDCYAGGMAWMSRAHKALIDGTVADVHYRKMLHELRQPVDDLKAFVLGGGRGVQKVQLFTADDALRAWLLEELPRRFDGLAVTSSVSQNIEINSAGATKGAALASLARLLELPRGAVMAIGDGLNDVSMLSAAGLAVAMGNAHEDVKRCAGYVTATNAECGVALSVEKFVLGKDV